MTQTVKNKEPRVFLKRGEGISRFDKGGLAQLRASALELGTAAHNGSVATHESAPARLAAASRPAAHHSRASTPAQQHRRPERTDQQQGFHVLEESIRRQTDGCWPSAEAAPDPLGGGASAPRQAANAEAWADADAGHAGSVAGWCLGSTGQAPGDDDGAGGGAGGGVGDDERGVLPCAQHARDAAHPAAAWLGGSAAVSASSAAPPPAAAAAGGDDWQPTWLAAAAGDGSGGSGGREGGGSSGVGAGGGGGGGVSGGGIAEMFSLAAAGGGSQEGHSDGGGNDGGWHGGGGGGGGEGGGALEGWPAAAAAAAARRGGGGGAGAGAGGAGGGGGGGDVAAAYCRQLTSGAGGATYDDEEDESWDLPPVSATSLSPQRALLQRAPAAVAAGRGGRYGGTARSSGAACRRWLVNRAARQAASTGTCCTGRAAPASLRRDRSR